MFDQTVVAPERTERERGLAFENAVRGLCDEVRGQVTARQAEIRAEAVGAANNRVSRYFARRPIRRPANVLTIVQITGFAQRFYDAAVAQHISYNRFEVGQVALRQALGALKNPLLKSVLDLWNEKSSQYLDHLYRENRVAAPLRPAQNRPEPAAAQERSGFVARHAARLFSACMCCVRRRPPERSASSAAITVDGPAASDARRNAAWPPSRRSAHKGLGSFARRNAALPPGPVAGATDAPPRGSAHKGRGSLVMSGVVVGPNVEAQTDALMLSLGAGSTPSGFTVADLPVSLAASSGYGSMGLGPQQVRSAEAASPLPFGGRMMGGAVGSSGAVLEAGHG